MATITQINLFLCGANFAVGISNLIRGNMGLALINFGAAGFTAFSVWGIK